MGKYVIIRQVNGGIYYLTRMQPGTGVNDLTAVYTMDAQRAMTFKNRKMAAAYQASYRTLRYTEVSTK